MSGWKIHSSSFRGRWILEVQSPGNVYLERPEGFRHHCDSSKHLWSASFIWNFFCFIFCVFSIYFLEPLELNTCSGYCSLMCILNIRILINGDLVTESWVLKSKCQYFFPSQWHLKVVVFQWVLNATFSIDMAVI